MFDGSDKLGELLVKTDSELSGDAPSSEYVDFIQERDLNLVAEPQKIAKRVEVPKRINPKVTSAIQGQVNDLGATPQSSAKGSKPFTTLVECCCGAGAFSAPKQVGRD